MIFVTVGMQLPFDRLVKAMDKLAPRLDFEVFAQIGDSDFCPENMRSAPFLNARDFEEKVSQASIIVSHAGVGSILAAQRNATPLVLLPRKAALREHRTDHQLDTVRAIHGRRGILSIAHESEIEAAISKAGSIETSKIVPAQASPSLQLAMKKFIDSEPAPALSRRIRGLFSR